MQTACKHRLPVAPPPPQDKCLAIHLLFPLFSFDRSLVSLHYMTAAINTHAVTEPTNLLYTGNAKGAAVRCFTICTNVTNTLFWTRFQGGVRLAIRYSILLIKFLPSIRSNATSLKDPATFCHFMSLTSVDG